MNKEFLPCFVASKYSESNALSVPLRLTMSTCGISSCLGPKGPDVRFRVVTSDTGARYVPSWEAIKQGCKCPTLIYWSFFHKEREIYLTPEGYSPIPSGKGAYFREPVQHDNVLGG